MDKIIPDALEYFDSFYNKSKEFDKNIIKNSKLIINLGDEHEKSHLFYNNTNKIPIEILGTYKNNIWKWAWGNPIFRGVDIQTSLQILEYGITYNITRDNINLKNKFINSELNINSDYEIEIIIAIITYITQNIYIYREFNNQLGEIWYFINKNNISTYLENL